MLSKKKFGKHFKWGVTISAFQNEGAPYTDGKKPSIWDDFTSRSEFILKKEFPGDTCDFYHIYKKDIELAAHLNFKVFRFSISWSRLIPDGTGNVNPQAVDFYNNVIDCCIKNGLEPWITIYHWDLPLILESKGGWINRDIILWFSEYTSVCSKLFGNRVKHWIVMNEPMTFVGMGYFMGYHAPGRTGIRSFLPAAHHAALCMAEGGRILRQNVPDAQIGIALSCSCVEPVDNTPANIGSARRTDAILNRFFIEPLLGMGYPTDVMPALKLINRYFQKGDKEKLAFDFDFIGLQYYFRVVTKFSLTPPILFAQEIPATERKAQLNEMNLEVYPEGLEKVINSFAAYPQIKSIIISEGGVCFPDFKFGKHVHDIRRINYYRNSLKIIKKAIKRGLPINGFLAWTLIDNFEWCEGYTPKFGLIYNDFKTQRRIIKDSGLWFKSFLK